MNSAEQFEAIVSEHYEPLFRFAMSLTRMESEARDLTQETFATWAAKGHQLRDITKVKAWLFTTLHRAFLKARRRQLRFSAEPLEEIPEGTPALMAVAPVQPDCSQVLPALAEVDEIYQAAVALFYLEDCSYNEIAAILEVPMGTVKSRISRGVGQLRKIMLPEAGFESPLNGHETFSIANTDKRAVTRENAHFRLPFYLRGWPKPIGASERMGL